MSACLEPMIVTIAHMLSVEILRVALSAFASQAILEMENLATFLVRKKIITSGKIKFYHDIIGNSRFLLLYNR